MAENPLVHLPKAWPALNHANDIRRKVVGRAKSVDLIRWDGVSYGVSPEQKMKIWELSNLCPRDGWPAVLLVHGGGWRSGSAEDFAALAPSFSHRGIMASAVNYRLAPQHRWPAQIEDVIAALEILHSQQVDKQRVAIWGHSAGGHLALQAAKLRPDLVRCVVAIGAPTDLTSLESDEPLSDIFDSSTLKSASPLHTESSWNVPTMLVHGTLDRVCNIEQARAFAASNEQVVLNEVTDGDHGLRWPPIAAWKAKRDTLNWLVKELDMPKRGSKWRRRKKKNR